MALQDSGPISASNINTELSRLVDDPFNLGGAEERELSFVPSGPISFSDFYSRVALTAGVINNPSAYNAAAGDNFGWSLAVTDTHTLVGAYSEGDLNSSIAGKAYLFSNVTGLKVFTFDNPVGPLQFGISVSIDGNLSLIGANTGIGAAYLFDNTTGLVIHSFDNPNDFSTANNDNFGISVSVNGNYSLIGANQEDDVGGTSSGKAYLFDNTTGLKLFTFDNPNPEGTSKNDQFGFTVSVNGNYSLIGAYQEDDTGSDSGKAYLFDNTTGLLLHTFDNPNDSGTPDNDLFGRTVAVEGNQSLIGAYVEDVAGAGSSGVAYLFDNTTGLLVHTFYDPNDFGTPNGDNFGWAVALSSTQVLISAIGEDVSGDLNSGKVYLFDRTTFASVHTFDNPNSFGTEFNDNFGRSVSLSTTYSAIGVPFEDDVDGSNAGVGFLFNNTTGSEVHALINPSDFGGSEADLFGSFVSASGTNILVGAPNEDDADGEDSGKAYLFNSANDLLLQTFDNPNEDASAEFDNFGFSVSVDGNFSLVGAPNEDDAGSNSGKVYLFDNTTGLKLFTFDNPDDFGSTFAELFGYSVSVKGNFSVIGAPRAFDVLGSSTGRVYIFDNTTGLRVQTFDNPNDFGTTASDAFGWSVSIDGNFSLIGSYQEDDASGTNSGKAYLFDNTTGLKVFTFDNPNESGTSANDSFGFSVSIDGNYSLIGAHAEDDAGGSDSGKVYLFDNTTGLKLFTFDNPNAFDTTPFDNFGRSVAVNGNFSLVGAHQEDDLDGGNSGKAYIFDNTTGLLVHTFDNPNSVGTSNSDKFGYAVALTADYTAIGAYQEDDLRGSNSGKVYTRSHSYE